MAIWQDLVDRHGFAAGYASVMRFVRRLRRRPAPEACATITTAPGEEAQVDYGEGPMVRHPTTGKYRRTRLFLLTLGYSRKSVRLLTWQSSATIWAQLHETAFRRLGGAPTVVILDNLREGVLRPDIYDPTLNPLYRDVLAHYGVTALPCRVGDPDRKGKVEAGIGYTQRTPLKGLRFERLEKARSTSITGTRAGPTPASTAPPSARSPRCLPRRARISGRSRRRPSATTPSARAPCTSTAASRSPRPTTASRPAALAPRSRSSGDARTVRILDPRTGALLREHERQHPGQYREDPDDRPRRTPPSTLQLLARAAAVGPHVGQLATTLHADDPLRAIRRIQGLLALARTYGPAPVALERHPPAPLTLRQVDPLIRQLTLYRDLLQGRAPQEGDDDDATP